MAATLLKLLPDAETKAVEYLDMDAGRIYADPEGLRLLRQVDEHEYLMTGSDQISGPPKHLVVDGQPVHYSRLSMAANAYYYSKVAETIGKPVQCKVLDRYGSAIPMTFNPGAVKMDLSPSDVHQPSTLPTYVGGYKIADGIADMMSPVVPVPHASDYYPTWNTSADFSRKMANASAAGGQVAEVNPGLAFTQFTTVMYALAGAMPTEVQANADAPIRPFEKTIQVVVDALRVEREARVVALMTATGSWNANLVQTILAGAQWNGGAASDPKAVLDAMVDASYLKVTAIGMSGQLFRIFRRNPAMQKFFSFKDRIPGVPNAEQLQGETDLPKIYVAEMKYTVNGALAFAWGNSVVGIHEPAQMPPTSQQDVATSTTFRWTGGPVPPDGALTGGLLVRTFFDPRRGARGANIVQVAHNDIEVMSSAFVGGLVVAARQ